MTERLDALTASVDRLRAVVGGLDAGQLTDSAYPSEWSIADTLSHLGSGAVIMDRRLQDLLAGVETPAEASQAVWDEWNAKAPDAQAADALVADRALMDRIAGLTDAERDGLRFAMGPMEFDFDGVVGLRLNEHVLHVWDIDVALDPTATLAPSAAGPVVDSLQMWVRFTAKPAADGSAVAVVTTDPTRGFVLTTGPDEVTLVAGDPSDSPDLSLPAEAFARLVYGRLDPDHTPTVGGAADLDGLRQVFPGA